MSRDFGFESCYAKNSYSRLNRSSAACSFKCSKHDPNNFLNNDEIHCNEATHFLILEFPRLFEKAELRQSWENNQNFIDKTFCKHEPEVYFHFCSIIRILKHFVTIIWVYKTEFLVHQTNQKSLSRIFFIIKIHQKQWNFTNKEYWLRKIQTICLASFDAQWNGMSKGVSLGTIH